MKCPPSPPRRRFDELEDEPLFAAIALVGLALFLVYRLGRAHPLAFIAALAGAALLAAGMLAVSSRIRGSRGGRDDPPGPGVIVGRVADGRPRRRGRPFFLPWGCFTRHVLIVGPTGRGKTQSFVDPILRAHVARPEAAVFYLDGKGSRVDLQDPATGRPGVDFDHVFCPEDPATSAHWNPLSGTDPVAAAARFAAALYPEAKQPEQYYAASASFVIKTVAPAMAFTGEGVTDLGRVRPHAELTAALIACGLGPDDADAFARNGEEVERQLHWLPYRENRDPTALAELLRRKAKPSASWPATASWPPPAPVTIRDLNALLFAGNLEVLRDAVIALCNTTKSPALLPTLDQLATNLDALLALGARERAEIMSNLRNRLGVFLAPPFLELCSRSDFDVADVCHGRSIAFLLSTGHFNDVAGPIGRVALAQFTQAVLSSTSERTKLAVLDEFHNFVDGSFAAFLNQARSYGGGAVMALQTIASLPIDHRDELLANPATVIVTPRCQPYDAEYFSKVFGTRLVEQHSYSYETSGLAAGPRRGSVRIDEREQPRYSPTDVAELAPLHAIAIVDDGKRSYGPTTVHVEHTID